MKVIIPMFGITEGGGSKVLYKLADLLVDMGHEVNILTLGNVQKYEKLNFKTKAHIEHIEINSLLKKLCRSIFLDFIKCYYLFKKIPNCDIVIANYFLTVYPVWLSKKAKHKFYYCQAFEPQFFYDHGQAFSSLWKKLWSRLGNLLYRKLAEKTYKLGLFMFANNELIVDRIKGLLDRRDVEIPVITSGVDISTFRPNYKENEILNVGIIATPAFWKGTKFFLDAVRILKSQNIEFEVTCAFGPPPKDSPDIEATWVNPGSQKQLADFYRSLDILVSPMLICGEFPLPPLEAMACNTAVISTKLIYGQDKQHYYDIPPKNSTAIANAIKKLITDTTLRKKIAKNGFLLSQEFRWENIQKRFIELITNYMEENRT